ncbi:serine/threonine-protein kinase [Actinokineospora soli]|uniref:non-specific serine/threonine protein kinase n=1 Tax=Actinokineospora soli TaxID=1048753 RepID=A0ABW2TT52_9PSEU
MSDLAGRYRLLRKLGEGAMGVVWHAVDVRLDREVAVKQLRTTAPDPQARDRAFREARIAARLRHPHTVTLYDVVDDGSGPPLLVMEYVPSHSLAAELTAHGPLPPTRVARIGAQIASALAAAHTAGVVHRDVKPANILLDTDNTAKITDFGISRATGDITLTARNVLAGTPAYLSPEAARGEPPAPTSDVFSLAATLYTALEGTPPFGNNPNPTTQLHRVAAGGAPPPRHQGPWRTS